MLCYLFDIFPYGTIIDKYESNGKFFFQCECYVPFRKKNRKPSLLLGHTRKMTLQVSADDFKKYDMYHEYCISPSEVCIEPQLAVA